MLLAPSTVCIHGSIPTFSPLDRLVASHVPTSGEPGSPARTSVQLLGSSLSAWRKYLPSVQSAASFLVTTAVPADPVNPLMKARLAMQSGAYSLMWGSSVGTTYASTLASSMAVLNASSLACGSMAADAATDRAAARGFATRACGVRRCSPTRAAIDFVPTFTWSVFGRRSLSAASVRVQFEGFPGSIPRLKGRGPGGTRSYPSSEDEWTRSIARTRPSPEMDEGR
mmetsp:Transcript_565/g.3990  ORF Transcript_565/g.3990 Transcript_565/m.3990 type:complete len:226 (+) Transcript_565:2448-3125(+)